MRKRILFYVRTGNGLGHLRRLSRLAEQISSDYSCLFVSGHKEMQWMVPRECEYYHIPFETIKERSAFLLHIENQYQPDAIVVDHSVNGNGGDVQQLLENSRAKKILILRGVLDSPQKIKDIYLEANSIYLISCKIDHIYIACDERIVSLDRDYSFFDSIIRSKMEFIGYVAPRLDIDRVDRVRANKTEDFTKQYIVSSPGGGYNNYELLNSSNQIAQDYKDINWEIIAGPKNSKFKTIESHKTHITTSNYSDMMDYLIAASDIFITKGGYNNLVEAISAGTFIICRPTGAVDDEQWVHILRLSDYYDNIIIVKEFADIHTTIQQVIDRVKDSCDNIECQLNLNGAITFHQKLNQIF